MRIAGIDLGLHGAIVLMDGRSIIEIHDMPTIEIPAKSKKARSRSRHDPRGAGELIDKLLPLDLVVIEKVHARADQGGAIANFAKGYAMGRYEGACIDRGIPYELVYPQTWKAKYGLLRKEKDESRVTAIRLWPGSASFFARKKDTDRAEAALLADFGRRKHASIGDLFDG